VAQSELQQATRAVEALAYDLANRKYLMEQTNEGLSQSEPDVVLGPTYDITTAASVPPSSPCFYLFRGTDNEVAFIASCCRGTTRASSSKYRNRVQGFGTLSS